MARTAKAEDGGGRATPIYAQVAAALRAEIGAGQLKAGDPLPTEQALTARFAVSRFTVREALRQLQDDGLIRRKRGSGTVVADEGPALRQSLGDMRAILQYAAASTFRIRHRGLARLSVGQARRLRRAAGEPWHHIEGLRCMDGVAEAMAVTDVFIHRRFAAHLGELRSGHEALFQQLERLAGVRVARVMQEIRAVAATPRQADALHVARRAPCLEILRTYLDSAGEVIEMSASVHPGERYSYAIEIQGEPE